MPNPIKALLNRILPSEDNTPLPASAMPDLYVTNSTFPIGRDFQGTPIDRSNAAEADITARACIAFRSNQIRRVQWRLLDNDGEDVKESSFHNMLKWHHMQHRQDFFDRWMTMLLVHGNVYMEKLYRDDNGIPGGIKIFNSTFMNPRIEYGVLQHYDYEPPDLMNSVEIPPRLILWDILPSLHSDWRGKSPMDRALDAVNLDRDNMQTIRSYLKNDAKPIGIATPKVNAPQNYDLADLKEFAKQLTEQTKGPGGGYGIKVMPAPLDVTAFSIEKPDMIYSYEMASLICREFHIDPALIGLQDQTDGDNRQRLSQMETKFINALTSAVLPDLYHLEDFINSHVLPFLSPMDDIKFSWNYDRIDRMIRYSDTSVDQLRSDFLAGAITLDEYRESRFFTPLGPEAGGDKFNVPKGYVHIPKDRMDELAKVMDPKAIEAILDMAVDPAQVATASPDFNQVAASDEMRPGANRYPVANGRNSGV